MRACLDANSGPVASEHLVFPTITSRLPVLLHPNSVKIIAQGVNWVHRYLRFASEDHRDALIAEQHGLWTCLTYPTGERDRVQGICDLSHLLFATDDAMSHGTVTGSAKSDVIALRDQVTTVVGGGAIDPGAAWAPGLHDAWTRLRAGMPAQQQVRFIASIDALLHGALHELALREDEVVPSFDEYLALRKDSVGAAPYFILSEYAIGADLTIDLADNPLFLALLDTTAEHVILVNDLFSYRKERYAGDGLINAVTVLRQWERLDLQAAMIRLSELIDATERAFIAKRDRIAQKYQDKRKDIHAVMAGLGYVLSGNLRWSRFTSRYHGATYPWDAAGAGQVSLLPDRTVFHDA